MARQIVGRQRAGFGLKCGFSSWALYPPKHGPLPGRRRRIMALRMRVHDREPIGLALRRFKKLMERSGLTKELRGHQHYEKPCEERRRAKLRKESAIRK